LEDLWRIGLSKGHFLIFEFCLEAINHLFEISELLGISE
jgi:hypothetical protein